jgi:hypothetical protein
MKATGGTLFFPVLTRRDAYSVKSDGTSYVYSHYRSEIAEDCQHRCVYCDARADEVGGAEAMQLDHFRPESFPEFEHLVNDPRNIHYACGRCNLWKSNFWPARGSTGTHNGSEGFVDPFSHDRRAYFEVLPDGRIQPLQPPAKYLIRLLRLDREYMRKLREMRILKHLCRLRVAEVRRKAEAGELPHPNELARTCAAIELLLI